MSTDTRQHGTPARSRLMVFLLLAVLLGAAGAGLGVRATLLRHPSYSLGQVMTRCLVRNPTDAEGCGNARDAFYNDLEKGLIVGIGTPLALLTAVYLLGRRKVRR